MEQELIYLSDMNEIIFSSEMKINAFELNGHKNERSELILEIINKIYDLLFDYLYETQLRNSPKNKNKNKNKKHNKNNKNKSDKGFGGKLSSIFINKIISDSSIINNNNIDILTKFSSILNIDSLFNNDYNRQEFNILFRLISMYQNNINEKYMSFLDPTMSIVILPTIKIPNGFLKYLQNRYPNWNKLIISKSKKSNNNNKNNNNKHQKIHSSTISATSTQISNQYDLGPPKSKNNKHNNQDVSLALDTMYEDKEYTQSHSGQFKTQSSQQSFTQTTIDS